MKNPRVSSTRPASLRVRSVAAFPNALTLSLCVMCAMCVRVCVCVCVCAFVRSKISEGKKPKKKAKIPSNKYSKTQQLTINQTNYSHFVEVVAASLLEVRVNKRLRQEEVRPLARVPRPLHVVGIAPTGAEICPCRPHVLDHVDIAEIGVFR